MLGNGCVPFHTKGVSLLNKKMGQAMRLAPNVYKKDPFSVVIAYKPALMVELQLHAV